MRTSVKSKDVLRMDLRVVFYHESGFWVAHCLEMDVLGHGKGKGKAMQNLADAIITQIDQSIENDNPGNVVQLADPKYFAMFFSGQDVAELSPILTPLQKFAGRTSKIQIGDVKAREFLRTPALV